MSVSAPLVGSTEEKEDIMGWGTLPGSEGLKSCIGTQALISDTRKRNPLNGLRMSGAYHRAVRNWIPKPVKNSHSELLIPSHSQVATD